MGWYAETAWAIEFKSPEDLAEAAEKIRCIPDLWGWGGPDPDNDEEIICHAVAAFNEDGDPDFDGLTLTSWGGGKAYERGSDPIPTIYEYNGETREYNNGGWGLYSIFAQHATGIVDWKGESDSYWRIRFHGDGRYTEHGGELVYPTDTENTD